MHRLLSDRLPCWKETILASYPFLGLLRTKENMRRAQGCTLHFRTPDPRSENSKVKMTERPQILLRIQAYILWFHFNSLQTPSSPSSGLPKYTWRLKTSLLTLPPLQTVPRRGTHRNLASINCFRTTGAKWRCVRIWLYFFIPKSGR